MSTIGLVGEKCGMTRVFTEDGASEGVTVLEIKQHRVVSLKTPEQCGYAAVQLTQGQKRADKLSKGEAGHFSKGSVEPGALLWENRFEDEKLLEKFPVGTEIKLEEIFSEGQIVDVSGISKGKGFAGVVKRHNFRTQDATHGNSLAHRAPGSIGQNQTPRRVFKGKKMCGQMGNVKKTVQNQKIVRIDAERGLVLLKGSVPGAPGGLVMLKAAVKIHKKEG
jgi:large subunit ribosomal protein L3